MIAVPFEVVHLVLLYNLILTDPVVLLRVITGSKFAGVKPLYAPPAELAFVYALPSTVLIVKVPPVISADEAVMTLPTGIQIVISFELLAIIPPTCILEHEIESPALITPFVRFANAIVLLPMFPLSAYRNWPFVRDVGVSAVIFPPLAFKYSPSPNVVGVSAPIDGTCTKE